MDTEPLGSIDRFARAAGYAVGIGLALGVIGLSLLDAATRRRMWRGLGRLVGVRFPDEEPQPAAVTSELGRGAPPPPVVEHPAPTHAAHGVVPPADRVSAAGRTTAPAAAPVVAPAAQVDDAPDRPGRQEPAADDGDPSGIAKLDLGPAGRQERPVAHIPWGYGQDRVTAAAVDPDRLYVYWEVTDQAIDMARSRLGPRGRDAWLDLRVYDTTGLLFDGTNAHAYLDQRVERSDRQWFFTIGKPTSSAFVEVGMRSVEGYFARIARSGRVDFPRKEPAPWTEPEWLTVVAASGPVVRTAPAGTRAPGSVAAAPSKGPPATAPQAASSAGTSAAADAPSFTPIPLWVLHALRMGQQEVLREVLEVKEDRIVWRSEEGEGWALLEGAGAWTGEAEVTTWTEGPLQYPVDVAEPTREEWQGGSFAVQVGGVTRVVSGPWEVVIRNVGAQAEHAVLARWEVYRSWVAVRGREVLAAPAAAAVPPGASEAVALGASERAWLSASELRLAGASEVWRRGASELRLRGASERLLAGASERRLGGASERAFRGASEQRLGGASERVPPGGGAAAPEAAGDVRDTTEPAGSAYPTLVD